MNKALRPAQVLVSFMQRIYDKGLTTMSGGNLSVLDDDGNIWITPSGIDKGTLTPEDIICVTPDGVCHGKYKPSCELPFHTAVYRLRPDVRAILHAHPPVPVSFSIVRRLPMQDLVCSTVQGEMSMAAYDCPGSEALGKKVSAVFAKGQNIAMLENHGLCVVAPDMFEAFRRFELLNYSAELELAARRLGTPQPIPAYHRLREVQGAPLPAGAADTAQEILKITRRCYRTGLFTAAQGSCSVRLPQGGFLMTPACLDLDLLEPQDLLWVTPETETAHTTAQLHAALYQARPEVNAVMTAQPPYLTAFAACRTYLDARTIPESYLQLRDLLYGQFDAYYDAPETLAAAFAPAKPAMLVENVGAVTTGNNLLKAFDRMEVMEATARSVIDTAPLGKIIHITDDDIETIVEAFDLPRA